MGLYLSVPVAPAIRWEVRLRGVVGIALIPALLLWLVLSLVKLVLLVVWWVAIVPIYLLVAAVVKVFT
ncbi:MAG TPA: hypothetical protein VHF06_00560 [Pseudonocardiaceae bacterium]|jgi:hypothetical protein|nr:hypothetical protein [Pseudonocardiaceae bacterium]